MSTFVMPHEIINSTPTALKPVDATQFSGTGSNFQKIVDEWTGGTNTDLFVAKLKGTAINTDMGAPNTIGEAGQTTFNGILGTVSGLPTSSGDTLALLEQRVNTTQAGVGSSGSNDGILDGHDETPWILSSSGTITAGTTTAFTLTNTGNLINIEPNNSYILQDAAATASGKQEIIKVASVTYGSGTIAVTPSVAYTNSYSANFTLGPTGATTANNSLQPNSAAVSTHAAYTKNVSIDHTIIEAKTNPVIECSYRVSEKWFLVSGMTDNVTITLTSITGDAAIMPAEYSTGVPFKGILFKLDKKGDKFVSPKSAALGGKNFIVLTHSGAATGTTTTTVPLTTANPVYGTAEATQTFNNNGTTQLKWGYLPLTILKELSVVDEASFESWVAMTIEKVILGKINGALIFGDLFERATLANNWSTGADGGGVAPAIDSSTRVLFNNTSAGTCWMYRSLEVYDIAKMPLIFSGQLVWGTNADQGFVHFSYGSDTSNQITAGGISWRLSTVTGALQLQILEGAVVKVSTPYTKANGDIYNFEFYLEKSRARLKWWKSTESKPTNYVLDYNKSGVALTLIGSYLNIMARDNDGNSNPIMYVNELKLQKYDDAITIRGSSTITGSGNKLSRKTTIYSFSRANSIPVELGSAVYAQ